MAQLENFSITQDAHSAKKILSFQIGLENNGEDMMKGIAEIIFAKLEDTFRAQIVHGVEAHLPQMLEKLGSDVAVAGLRELLKEKQKDDTHSGRN